MNRCQQQQQQTYDNRHHHENVSTRYATFENQPKSNIRAKSTEPSERTATTRTEHHHHHPHQNKQVSFHNQIKTIVERWRHHSPEEKKPHQQQSMIHSLNEKRQESNDLHRIPEDLRNRRDDLERHAKEPYQRSMKETMTKHWKIYEDIEEIYEYSEHLYKPKEPLEEQVPHHTLDDKHNHPKIRKSNTLDENQYKKYADENYSNKKPFSYYFSRLTIKTSRRYYSSNKDK